MSNAPPSFLRPFIPFLPPSWKSSTSSIESLAQLPMPPTSAVMPLPLPLDQVAPSELPTEVSDSEGGFSRFLRHLHEREDLGEEAQELSQKLRRRPKAPLSRQESVLLKELQALVGVRR